MPDGDHVVAWQVDTTVVSEEMVYLVLLSILGCEVFGGDWLLFSILSFRLLSRGRVDHLASDLSHDDWGAIHNSSQRRRVDLEGVLDQWDLEICDRSVAFHICRVL